MRNTFRFGANGRARSMARASAAIALAVAMVAAASPASYGQGDAQNQTPRAARSRAEETLEGWNEIGNKLVAMAKDFPDAKYDFKVQKDQRTFAQDILHAAAVDYEVIRAVAGTPMGPDFGKDVENPSRDVYKTKADVVKLMEQAVADGASLIQKQGEAGLDKTSKLPWANRLVHNSYLWSIATEHSGEHYGQLVVYYRANDMIPPESRPH